MSSCDSGASSRLRSKSKLSQDGHAVKKIPSDVEEGRTIFIRNLSFDVDDSELESFFTNFGEILFARVVKDHGTQHSKGSGFVKFVKKEDCANVLLDSAKGENFQKFTLRGRTLDLRLAISREAARQTSSSKEVTSEQIFESEAPCVPGAPLEDINLSGRNLHLASLGMIRPGSKAAEGLSGHDLAKRDALLRSKKFKLRNPNIFVSQLRLSIHNLPKNLTDSELLRICKRVVKDSSAYITECRIMRDLTPGRTQNQSLCYGFVAFEEHRHALACLNAMNNNPDLFLNRRPIVEFSLENMMALEKKRRRAEKSAIILANKRNESQTDKTFPPPECAFRYSKQLSTKQNRCKRHASTLTDSTVIGLPRHFNAKNRHRNNKGGHVVRSKEIHKQMRLRPSKLSRKQLRAQKQMLIASHSI